MSTPMAEVPEHVMIPLDVNDQGPADPEDTVRWACWCNTDCGTVQHINSSEGTKMCEDFADVVDVQPVLYEDPSKAGGRCTLCAGYALALQRMLAEGRE